LLKNLSSDVLFIKTYNRPPKVFTINKFTQFLSHFAERKRRKGLPLLALYSKIKENSGFLILGGG